VSDFWEDTAIRLHLGRTEQPSLDTEPASVLILDLSVSQTVRNKFLLYINYPASGRCFVVVADMD
jgi:hypothetical protein